MVRPHYSVALRRTGIMRTLAEFDPHLAGTLPLAVDVPTSDLDVLCHAPDPDVFVDRLWAAHSSEATFSLHQWVGADRPVIASFVAHGWPFQIFGQNKPVEEQNGWRHFVAERRLLELAGPALRAAVMRERSLGAKTEPAFATVLNLQGDPYRAILDVERYDRGRLIDLLRHAGFDSRSQSADRGPP